MDEHKQKKTHAGPGKGKFSAPGGNKRREIGFGKAKAYSRPFPGDESRHAAERGVHSGSSYDKRPGPDKDSEKIIGRNAVLEALRANRPIAAVYVTRGEKNGSIVQIISMARQRGIPIKEADQKKLSFMCGGGVHQGVVATAAVKEFSTLDDVFARAGERNEPPFIVICDEIEDPHNLGAIIRSAECSGAHGVIIPKHRGVGLTFAVGKASAGAYEHIPVVQAQNLSVTLDELKSRGLWIYAADMDGEPWCQRDLKGPLALVIGSEGKGVGRLIKKKCDFTLAMPMLGKISSLNASVAAGILCYEICRQRQGIKAVN